MLTVTVPLEDCSKLFQQIAANEFGQKHITITITITIPISISISISIPVPQTMVQRLVLWLGRFVALVEFVAVVMHVLDLDNVFTWKRPLAITIIKITTAALYHSCCLGNMLPWHHCSGRSVYNKPPSHHHLHHHPIPSHRHLHLHPIGTDHNHYFTITITFTHTLNRMRR